MLLHQAAYRKRVLEKFGMDSAKPAPTLMVENINYLFLEGSSETLR